MRNFYLAFKSAVLFVCVCAALLAGPVMAAAPVASRLATLHGKTVVLVQDRPYLMYGVQLRLDDFLGSDDSAANWARASAYFEKARSLGFRTVIIPVHWSTIEPTEGHYDFASYVDPVISNADHYKLSVQLLWYGSDVCGFDCAPAYVEQNHTRFPRNPAFPQFLDLSSPALVARESAALAALMTHLAVSDRQRRVIMMQIENEPDGAADLPVDWNSAVDRARKQFAGGQYTAVRSLINTLGDLVHHSADSMVTRDNGGTSEHVYDLFQTRSGVDIFGVDTYQHTPAGVKRVLQSIPVDTLGNVPHQPEGGGQYANLISLILSNFEEGGTYMVYELRTVGRPYDLGIYRKTTAQADIWQERDGTALVPYGLDGAASSDGPENKTMEIRSFNALVDKADQQIAQAKPGDCTAFGIDDTLGTGTETKTVGRDIIGYHSENHGQAFVMHVADGSLIFMSLKNGSIFTLDAALAKDAHASVGYFDERDRWVQTETRPVIGGTLTLNAGEVIRLYG